MFRIVTTRSTTRKKIGVTLTAAFALAALSTLGSSAAYGAETTYFRTDTEQFKASAKLGRQMFDAFQCAKCHAVRDGQPLTDDIVAPNLILSKDRLQPAWMLQWLIDPQELQPGTKMPNFFSFNEDDDFNPILGDADAHEQYKIIVAIRDYLMILGTEKERELFGSVAGEFTAPPTAASDDSGDDAANGAEEDSGDYDESDYY